MIHLSGEAEETRQAARHLLGIGWKLAYSRPADIPAHRRLGILNRVFNRPEFVDLVRRELEAEGIEHEAVC